MAEVKEAAATKIVTGKVRFSYLHVFEPQAVQEGGDKKYSVSLIIPKSDKALVAKITAAINAAKEAGKSSKFGGKVPANLKTPLRDGDVERPEDDVYANAYFINASAKNQPGLVDKNLQKIIDQSELYSGCFGRASITFYAFNTSGNKGIAAGLNNLQKLEDGEPLGGRSRAEDDFEAVEDDDLI
jgi:hypothetical protein